MYTEILFTHNIFRWLVLLALVVSVVMAFSGWFGKREWRKSDNASGLILVILIDLQFLIGVVLYFFLSPITKAAINDFGTAMKNADLRFYAVEHIMMMVIALVLVHVGRSRSKRSKSMVKQHRSAVIFYPLALLVILAAIPWERAFI